MGQDARSIEIRVVDVGDEAQLRAWWEVYHAAEAERTLQLSAPWEAARLSWSYPSTDEDIVLLGAFRGGTMIGAARSKMPHRDNDHMAFVECYVDPAHRRSGAGRALMSEIERIGITAGRTVFLGTVYTPPEQRNAGAAFAGALGYPSVGRDEMKSLDLAVSADRLPALATRAAEASSGYELTWWTGPMPDALVAGMCELYTRFLAEIPMEGLAIQPPRLR